MCIILSKILNRYLLFVLSIISIALSWNVIPHNEIFTRYLNPFNFIIYFELGKWVREYNIQIKHSQTLLPVSLFFLFMIGCLWPSIEPCYFSILCIPFVIAAFIGIDCFFRLVPLRFLIPIGKYSFVIYLCHIQIAGVINGRLHGVFEFIKVPIAFLITCVFVHIVYLTIRRKKNILVWLGYR